jgi:hypothetical protein
MPSGTDQLEMNFDFSDSERGFTRWHEERRDAMRRLAAQMGLPLGHNVIVRLRDGVELKGFLRLKEEKLFIEDKRDFSLELIVDNVPFTAAEIEACVRMD